MKNDILSKYESSYLKLKEEIMAGKFSAGERLIVNDISKRYDVSSMPVRKAIDKLALDGLVKVVPNQGATVHIWDYDEFHQLIQISIALEGMASRLAAFYISDENIAKLESIIHKMKTAIYSRNLTQYNISNHEFHFTIYRSSCNPELYDKISQLHTQTYPYTSIALHSKNRIFVSFEEHSDWLEAIKNRDGKSCEYFSRLQRTEAYVLFLDHLEYCIEHLDIPEYNYYIYGFTSTFSKLTLDEIKKKIDGYRESIKYFL